MRLAAYVIAAAGLWIASLKWLRVIQREHYISGYASRFAFRWWKARPLSIAMLVLTAVMAVFLALRPSGIALLGQTAVAAALLVEAPQGLAITGRTSKLAFTARMMRLAGCVWLLLAVGLVALWFVSRGLSAWVVLAVLIPAVVDFTALVTGFFERIAGKRYVNVAEEKLGRLSPSVIAVAGSYGKTTTKVYIRHLLSGTRQVVASPASFNNQMGLARTVNENLMPGTEVLIAEMGDYGPGEIAEMCRWLRPEVGVITGVGYEHFERFGSMDAIARSKREIFDGVRAAVLNIDSSHLREMAGDLDAAGGVEIIRCSGGGDGADLADVVASVDGDHLAVVARGDEIARIERLNRHPSNVACAVGAALAMGTPVRSLVELLPGLEAPAHRATVEEAQNGALVIDDTYNSNPVGAAAALDALRRHAADGRRVVVTPGMVEMGREQYRLNREFAAKAAEVASDFLVAGYTNRKALVDGFSAGGGPHGAAQTFETREKATEWVRENLGRGDIVLYENDLPDHFP